jgi:hypothetical protein
MAERKTTTMTTTYRDGRARMSPLFLALAGISLALASWGYFDLFTRHAGMPTWLALFAVGGLDLAAVLIGKHALTVAQDGDSSAPWNLALILLTALGSFAQFQHAYLNGDAIAVGVVSAAFPVVTVLLFEGQLRRVYRLNGRAAGRLSEPRATVDLITWLFYRRLALRATRLAVLDRGLDQDTALMIAERQLTLEAEADVRPARRRMRRTYSAELGGDALEELDVHTPKADNGGDVRRRGELAAAIRTAREAHGDNLTDVLEDVRTKFPDVQVDTVRRTLARLAAS